MTCARAHRWGRGCRTSRSCRAPCRRNAAFGDEGYDGCGGEIVGWS